MDGGIRYYSDEQLNLLIEWTSHSRGSISTAAEGGGIIRIDALAVPYSLYFIGKQFQNFEFIPYPEKMRILQQNMVGFAELRYDKFANFAEENSKLMHSIWVSVLAGSNGSRRLKDEIIPSYLREESGIDQIIEELSKDGIDCKTLDYEGYFIGPRQIGPIHILLSPAGATYIIQDSGELNILRSHVYQTKGMIKYIIGLYGSAVSAALRLLIENREK